MLLDATGPQTSARKNQVIFLIAGQIVVLKDQLNHAIHCSAQNSLLFLFTLGIKSSVLIKILILLNLALGLLCPQLTSYVPHADQCSSHAGLLVFVGHTWTALPVWGLCLGYALCLECSFPTWQCSLLPSYQVFAPRQPPPHRTRPCLAPYSALLLCRAHITPWH